MDAVVAVDFEGVETGKIEAGSGIKSTFPCATFSSTWVSLDCKGGDCVCWWNSDSGGIVAVDRADGTGEVNGKELVEHRVICSAVDATATRDISSPKGERETAGLVFGVGGAGACDSGMEVELDRGE
jgi:hypothetical protein